MEILCIEEIVFEGFLIRRIVLTADTESSIYDYFLKFVVEDLVDCLLVSLKMNLVLKPEEILKQGLIAQAGRELVCEEFGMSINCPDDVRMKLEIEVGYDKLLSIMLKLSYFVLQKKKNENDVELRFLDSFYEVIKK